MSFLRLVIFHTALLATSIPLISATVLKRQWELQLPSNFSWLGNPLLDHVSPPYDSANVELVSVETFFGVVRHEYNIPPPPPYDGLLPPMGPTFIPLPRPLEKIISSLLPKRDNDLQGNTCVTACGFSDKPKPVQADCEVVYNTLYSKAVAFTSRPRTLVMWTYQNCSAFFINNTPDAIVYDHWDYGGVSQWLNGNCMSNPAASIGTCLFSIYSQFSTGAYVSVNHPNYFG